LNPPKTSLYFLYHELRDADGGYSYAMRSSQFEKHLELFTKARTADGAAVWPEITFDDGHISNYTHALPALAKGGILGTFFITAGWTGQKPEYMGWQELRSLLAAGHTIGAHGWSHTLLTHCDDKQLQVELVQAKQSLEDGLGISVPTISLPGGRYNSRVLQACKEAGYERIYTSVPQVSTGPQEEMTGRVNIVQTMSLQWIEGVLQPESPILARAKQQYRVKAAAKSILGDSLYAKVWAVLNRKEPGNNEG
jgi:peptidoglycan/xylan/chitin deacetylase (PgdA/CDA1 family)